MTNNKSEQAESLIGYIDQLFRDAGLDKLPESFRDEYGQRLALEAQRRIGVVVMTGLAPEVANKFLKLTESGAGQTVVAEFLKKNVPDYEQKTAMALEEFRQEFLKSAQSLEDNVAATK